MPDYGYKRTVVNNAFVWNQDKSIELRRTVFKSTRGYYIVVSKFSGLDPKIRKPKRGGTTIWLTGSPQEGFILPRGVFAV
jgi:hypothetical protein